MTEPSAPARRIRVTDFATAKRTGQRWAMLTSYDQYTAALFEDAGVWSLLVGDSAANNVYGYESTLPVTVDELLPLVRAVVRSTRRAFVVGDLPFGSYEAGPGQALQTAIRFMKASSGTSSDYTETARARGSPNGVCPGPHSSARRRPHLAGRIGLLSRHVWRRGACRSRFRERVRAPCMRCWRPTLSCMASLGLLPSVSARG